ncbi:protein SMG9 [Trifolium repens]|nr:protein SMG9 [Trifolium repens]
MCIVPRLNEGPFSIQSEEHKAVARHYSIGIEPRIFAECITLLYTQGYCSNKGEEYSSLESCSLTLFEIRRKLLRWSFRKALLGMELIHHSYSQSAK